MFFSSYALEKHYHNWDRPLEKHYSCLQTYSNVNHLNSEQLYNVLPISTSCASLRLQALCAPPPPNYVTLSTSRAPSHFSCPRFPCLCLHTMLLPTSGCPSRLPSPMGNLEMTWQQYRKVRSFRVILPLLINAILISGWHSAVVRKQEQFETAITEHLKNMNPMPPLSYYISLCLTCRNRRDTWVRNLQSMRICISSSWAAPRWRCHEVGTSTWLVARGSPNFLQKTTLRTWTSIIEIRVMFLDVCAILVYLSINGNI